MKLNIDEKDIRITDTDDLFRVIKQIIWELTTRNVTKEEIDEKISLKGLLQG